MRLTQAQRKAEELFGEHGAAWSRRLGGPRYCQATIFYVGTSERGKADVIRGKSTLGYSDAFRDAIERDAKAAE